MLRTVIFLAIATFSLTTQAEDAELPFVSSAGGYV